MTQTLPSTFVYNARKDQMETLPEMRTLARRVKALRKAKNMSRASLATASGLSIDTIRRVETANKTGYNPKLDTLGYIAFGLQAPLSEVVSTPKKVATFTFA